MKKIIIILFILIQFTYVLATPSSENNKSEYTYYVVSVSDGDCLWDIARKYNKDFSDIRDYVNFIKKFNKLDSYIIKTGQQLIIPVLTGF